LTAEAEKAGLRSRGGKRIGRSALHGILRDPIYKGFIRFNGIVARGSHEPLIDADLWTRIQAQLAARNTNVSKPKDNTLRELFTFGNLLRCPECGRSLCPYRAKKRYVYYECKNKDTRCRVIVPQLEVVAQLRPLLESIRVGEEDLERLRAGLLREHREQTRDDSAKRRSLNAAYETLQREIGDLFAQRKEAEALGVLDAVDSRLEGLKCRRDELQGQLDALHHDGTELIEASLGSFRFIEQLGEAILYGSSQTREMGLRAVASNYTVKGGTLVPELRSPFRQRLETGGCPSWWAGLHDVRTEIMETFRLLQAATAAFHGA
jgi:hypothetical protein